MPVLLAVVVNVAVAALPSVVRRALVFFLQRLLTQLLVFGFVHLHVLCVRITLEVLFGLNRGVDLGFPLALSLRGRKELPFLAVRPAPRSVAAARTLHADE